MNPVKILSFVFDVSIPWMSQSAVNRRDEVVIGPAFVQCVTCMLVLFRRGGWNCGLRLIVLVSLSAMPTG